MSAQELQFQVPLRKVLHSLANAWQRITSRRKMGPLDELIERPPAEPTWYAVRNGVDCLNVTCGAMPPTTWKG